MLCGAPSAVHGVCCVESVAKAAWVHVTVLNMVVPISSLKLLERNGCNTADVKAPLSFDFILLF